jgi:hypothetical protein
VQNRRRKQLPERVDLQTPTKLPTQAHTEEVTATKALKQKEASKAQQQASKQIKEKVRHCQPVKIAVDRM